MDEDDLLTWIPEFFLPVKHDATAVEGYVTDEQNLQVLLDAHSRATQSVFVRKYVGDYFTFIQYSTFVVLTKTQVSESFQNPKLLIYLVVINLMYNFSFCLFRLTYFI